MPPVILYVNATSELGGTDTDLLATVRALDKSRFTPLVALPHRGPFDDHYAAMGVEVVHLPLPIINRAVRPHALARSLPTSVAQLRRLIRVRDVRLVYTNSLLVLSAGIAARLCRRAALWHSGELFERPRLVGEALYWTTGALADRVIVSSEAVRARFPSWARHRVTVLRNGIDLSRFHPDRDGTPVRRELGIPLDAPLVGFVGRFMPWKGAHQFVEIAARVRARVPETHFLIAGARLKGYEAYVDDVRALVDARGLGQFTRFVEDRSDVPNLMAALDVFVHCSLRPEPFGIVIVEAMAAGKPVVAVNAGGVPEIVSSPAIGRLVPLGDTARSAEAVCDLLEHRDRARAMGATARAHVETHFEINAVTRQAEALYVEAMARHA